MSFFNIPLAKIISASITFLIGLLVAQLLSRKIEKVTAKKLSPHQTMLIRRLVYSLVFLLFLISTLQQLGFQFGVLLGAAGVLTVGLSFASQTSAANLISGIFLLIERPFKIGDLIEVKSMLGKVHSIDLLSTKIVTPDNKLIRFPNESLIKTEITNLSYFKTRRLDLLISIAYEGDLKVAVDTLKTIAEQNTIALKQPTANVEVSKLLDSAIELKLSVWAKSTDIKTLKTDIQTQILEAFKEQGIEIPYPQIVVHKPLN